MGKTFTLFDLQFYLQEVRQAEDLNLKSSTARREPAHKTVQNILRYSSALQVMKTTMAGPVLHLAN